MAKAAKKSTKTQKGQFSTGQVRLIAGQWRGRKLPVLLADGLRPTTDRVKETLFNWLMADVAQSHCLDCFAGAASLGLEALSRGAKQCTFIELNKSAANQIKKNLTTLNCNNAQVFNQDALSFLSQKAQHQFDIVFVDPPFRQNLASKACQLLEENQHLSDDALVYVEVESEAGSFEAPLNWQVIKEKTAGQVTYRLYQREV